MPELEIKIPQRFIEKLANTEWDVIVRETILNIQPLVKVSPKFFPEYTLHGIDHINHVLFIADKLIPKEVIQSDRVSPKDLGILICSILIHDLGMFIDNSKVCSFIQDNTLRINGFSPNEPYTVLWQDYCNKIKRYSPRQWNNLIGSETQTIPSLTETGNWTEREYLVMGEFLRWYHPRIAHEIALYDFMDIKILSERIPKQTKNVIGLIARSHGMNIRDAEIENYCKTQFGSNDYIGNCPVYYLMSVLRLADYLDAGVERAPKMLSDVHVFTSKTSRDEWILNQNFQFESFGWRKAESTRTLDLPASPASTTEFVRAEKMLLSIQSEFDSSVAIIEEIYQGEYNLSINRVTSNILKNGCRNDLSLKFVLKETKLGACPNILPLLVGPLYSNDPSYGVRELIQNSVDACSERGYIDNNYTGKIIINIDTDSKMFSITDDGIGMSEDIIRNYYLTAGSSYRYSENWSNLFTDSSDEPNIARIGRFGIGALATFLLGKCASVSTRRHGSDIGYKFCYSLNTDEPINVICDKSIDVGTTICITMSDMACSYFKNSYNKDEWTSWYRFEKPEIEINIDEKKIINENILPVISESKEGWFTFNSKYYNQLIWSYSGIHPETGKHFSNELICNGIPIDKVEPRYHINTNRWGSTHWSIIRNRGFDVHLPIISLIDNNAYLDMDLSRRHLNNFPIEDGFVKEIYKYILSELLIDSYFDNFHGYPNYTIWESQHGYIPLAFSDNGYTILSRSFILNTGSSIWCYIGERDTFKTSLPIGYMSKMGEHDVTDSIHYGTTCGLLGKTFINGDLLIDKFNFKKCCGVVIVKSNTNSLLITNTSIALRDYFGDEFKDIYLLNPNGAALDSPYLNDIFKFVSNLKNENSMVVEYIPTPIKEGEKNIMLEILQKYIPTERNGGWIPYNLEDRKRIYPEAYKDLDEYINTIASLKNKRYKI